MPALAVDRLSNNFLTFAPIPTSVNNPLSPNLSPSPFSFKNKKGKNLTLNLPVQFIQLSDAISSMNNNSNNNNNNNGNVNMSPPMPQSQSQSQSQLHGNGRNHLNNFIQENSMNQNNGNGNGGNNHNINNVNNGNQHSSALPLCRHFPSGKCRYGDICRFSHSNMNGHNGMGSFNNNVNNNNGANTLPLYRVTQMTVNGARVHEEILGQFIKGNSQPNQQNNNNHLSHNQRLVQTQQQYDNNNNNSNNNNSPQILTPTPISVFELQKEFMKNNYNLNFNHLNNNNNNNNPSNNSANNSTSSSPLPFQDLSPRTTKSNSISSNQSLENNQNNYSSPKVFTSPPKQRDNNNNNNNNNQYNNLRGACKYWSLGTCRYGTMCNFIHSSPNHSSANNQNNINNNMQDSANTNNTTSGNNNNTASSVHSTDNSNAGSPSFSPLVIACTNNELMNNSIKLSTHEEKEKESITETQSSGGAEGEGEVSDQSRDLPKQSIIIAEVVDRNKTTIIDTNNNSNNGDVNPKSRKESLDANEVKENNNKKNVDIEVLLEEQIKQNNEDKYKNIDLNNYKLNQNRPLVHDIVYKFKSIKITDKAIISVSPNKSNNTNNTSNNHPDGRMLVIESVLYPNITFRSLVMDYGIELIELFRDLFYFLEVINGINDHHIKIEEVRTSASSLQLKQMNNNSALNDDNNNDDSQHGFILRVLFGGIRSEPRYQPCVSCDLSHPMANISLFKRNDNNTIWFDAQCRPMLVVTPNQHIERLEELNDKQVYTLFKSAYLALDELEGLVKLGRNSQHHNNSPSTQSSVGTLMFRQLLLNHGTYRNWRHLHIKARIDERLFERIKQNFPPQIMNKWNTLMMMMASHNNNNSNNNNNNNNGSNNNNSNNNNHSSSPSSHNNNHSTRRNSINQQTNNNYYNNHLHTPPLHSGSVRKQSSHHHYTNNGPSTANNNYQIVSSNGYEYDIDNSNMNGNEGNSTNNNLSGPTTNGYIMSPIPLSVPMGPHGGSNEYIHYVHHPSGHHSGVHHSIHNVQPMSPIMPVTCGPVSTNNGISTDMNMMYYVMNSNHHTNHPGFINSNIPLSPNGPILIPTNLAPATFVPIDYLHPHHSIPSQHYYYNQTGPMTPTSTTTTATAPQQQASHYVQWVAWPHQQQQGVPMHMNYNDMNGDSRRNSNSSISMENNNNIVNTIILRQDSNNSNNNNIDQQSVSPIHSPVHDSINNTTNGIIDPNNTINSINPGSPITCVTDTNSGVSTSVALKVPCVSEGSLLPSETPNNTPNPSIINSKHNEELKTKSSGGNVDGEQVEGKANAL